jgi:hypothetical protein
VRQVLHALIVATIALAVLASAARAETLGRVGVAGGVADEGQQRGSMYATVVKAYGAAVRVGPASDAPIMFNTGCGDIWPVMETAGGWVKVRTDDGPGWIGGARVIVSSGVPSLDCGEARFFVVNDDVKTYVATGCLSLRATPSRDGAILACVKNDHNYRVIDGPVDAGTGEDWFKVTSASTGPGWVLADHIYN